MHAVRIGRASISRLCIGGNPFSGFSHQGPARNLEMKAYYTPERTWATLRAAELAGIDTFFGRTDEHIFGILRQYWEAGGRIQWFAQVSWSDDRDGWEPWLRRAVELGATGAYMHGGAADNWVANGQFDELKRALDAMRKSGVVAGFAGHRPDAHAWIRDNLDVDFQMCSHYNPTDRSKSRHHIAIDEKWHDEDRARMLEVIATIRKPVVHYKVFAGGNKPIVPAFERLAKAMRPHDAVVVGFFTRDKPDIIQEDVSLFEQYVDRGASPGGCSPRGDGGTC